MIIWDWWQSIKFESRPSTEVMIVPRGGGKSTTAELGMVYVGGRLERRYGLYVCGTSEQAEEHIADISDAFGSVGVKRSLNEYGASEGWSRTELHTQNGFVVRGIGLKQAVRGTKMKGYRPDLFVLDDVDGRDDTAATTKKKITTLTEDLFPAGAPNYGVLVCQNMVKEDGIVHKLATGKADFLLDRKVHIERAINGLEYESYDRQDGKRLWRITAGTPTWGGQDIAKCEADINVSLTAFLRECQHEVEGADGVFFAVSQFRHCKPEDVPLLWSVCLAGDIAGTEGGGNYTVFTLMGRDKQDRIYILAVIRGQWGSDRVFSCLDKAIELYYPIYQKNGWRGHLPQDGGQAGKDQNVGKYGMAARYGRYGFKVEPVTGSKASRARGFQEQVNKGNVWLVDADLPAPLSPWMRDKDTNQLRYYNWQADFVDVLRRFDENEKDQDDDDVDSAADSYTEIATARGGLTAGDIRTK